MSDASKKVYEDLAGAIEIRDDSGHTAKLSGGSGTILGFVEDYERIISEEAERALREMLKDTSLPDGYNYRLGYAKGAKDAIAWLLKTGRMDRRSI